MTSVLIVSYLMIGGLVGGMLLRLILEGIPDDARLTVRRQLYIATVVIAASLFWPLLFSYGIWRKLAYNEKER